MVAIILKQQWKDQYKKTSKGNFLVKDLMNPPGIKKWKFGKILKKSGDLQGSLRDPLQPFFGP